MVGEKKSRTTNLDFPSVLLNQGLTEANNNTRRRKLPLPSFHKEEEKRGKRRDEKRGKETVNIAESSTRRRRLLVNTFRHKTTKARTRITHNKRNNESIYKNTITNDEIVTTPEENKHRSLETSAKRRRKSISSREKEVLRARAIWTFPDRRRSLKEKTESNRDTKKNKKK